MLPMKTVAVLPAFNCAKTLALTIAAIPSDVIDDIILVDDCSRDGTCEIARKLGISLVLRHNRNRGYGANQKTCYRAALSIGADVVIMIHPDYQYDPKLMKDMAATIENGFDVVLGSRMMMGKEALRGGMPAYKYYANRFLTRFQNTLLGENLSEYHTGYRSYTKEVLSSIDFDILSDDFIFDNQILLECITKRYKIAEIYCPARYNSHSSSINFARSMKYGLQVLYYTLKYKFS